MKITYTAPNRPHNYPYAEAMHRAGHLHAFVSGFSRFSPRSALPSIGSKLKRHDLIKSLHLACLKMKLPFPVTAGVDRLAASRLDHASYPWAKQSDAFIYFRTEGYSTTRRLHREGAPTLCVMEEVNSHVEFATDILEEEYKRLGHKNSYEKDTDHALRIKAYDDSDFILVPSEFVCRSFLAKGFSRDRLIKVNFGFPPIEISPMDAVKTDTETFRLLYVGQLHFRKGLRYAIEAFRKLKHPKKEFVIVGPKTRITGLENTSLPDGVIFTGPLKGEFLKEQYRRASVFVLPSLEEGLALVQGEALAFGIPLLITTNTGGDDIITDGLEGFIVDPAQTDPLTERLQQMADDKVLLNHMSLAALRAAQKLGSWDRAAHTLISELNKKMIGRHSMSFSTPEQMAY